MRKILFDLYHGNFATFEPPFTHDSKQSEAFGKVEELEEKLHCVLSEEHQPLLRDLSNAYLQLMDAVRMILPSATASACGCCWLHGRMQALPQNKRPRTSQLKFTLIPAPIF